ncbi:MAG: hypothetical protein WCT10_05650 [Patescibacteria group bacterium]|jgi:hypothetical protein
MRPGFRTNLEAYGEIAKDEMRLKAAEDETAEKTDAAAREETERLATVLDWHAEKRAEKSGTSQDIQYEIFDIQKRKQKIMARLKEELRELDHPSEQETEPAPDCRRIRQENGQLFWKRADGKDVPVTVGEIVTDLAWGIDYDLDRETVPRLTRKRLLIERTKYELEDLLDLQILTEEIASGNTHPERVRAYEARKTDRETGEPPFGILAEKIMVQFLRKLSIDHKLDFDVTSADIYQDVTQKIDFIIRRNVHNRGVRLEEGGPELAAKGVQFTMNNNRVVLRRKAEQIEKSKQRLSEDDHIDDIMLVVFDSRTLGEAFDKWRADRTPGGPDQFLDPKLRKRLFFEMLGGLATNEELEEQWSGELTT